jgi:hypothetical protein
MSFEMSMVEKERGVEMFEGRDAKLLSCPAPQR